MSAIDLVEPDSPTTPDMVRWAFLTILGRKADSDDLIRFHQETFPRFEDLCRGLKDSVEFANVFAARAAELAVLLPERLDPSLKMLAANLFKAKLGRLPDEGALAESVVALRRTGGLAGVGSLAAIVSAVLAPSEARFNAALPARPPAPWRFVGREREMLSLIHWLQGDRHRLFLEGPDGAGQTTLAAEFGRRLATAGGSLIMPGYTALDHVIFVKGGVEEGSDIPLFARILTLAGGGRSDRGEDQLDRAMSQFLDSGNGLIIIDGAPDSDADERLLVKVVGARGRTRLLYTQGPSQRFSLDPQIPVQGFSEDAEYRAFFEAFADRVASPLPGPGEYEAIARWSHGLPKRMLALLALRQSTQSYADAITLAGVSRQPDPSAPGPAPGRP